MDNRKPINPFRVGTAIKDPADFIGRQELLRTISGAMSKLQNFSLHGERRTGKTSLLLYLTNSASTSVTKLQPTHIPVYIDFQRFVDASATSVWHTIADAICDQIQRRLSNGEHETRRFQDTLNGFGQTPESFVTGLGGALTHLGNSGIKIHLMFDEFEQTAENPNLGDSFYHALRSLPTLADNISYVIATRTGLAALQPTYNEVSSLFFNLFTSEMLGFFSTGEAEHLIFDYFARAELDPSLAEKLWKESSFLYDATGYHPFFLQTMCYHLFEWLAEPDWPLGQAKQKALRNFERDTEGHFEFYWQVSAKREQELMIKAAMEEPIDRNQRENTAAARSLEDRCLATQSDTGWRLFSTTFAEWVGGRQLAAWYKEGIDQQKAAKLKSARETFQRICRLRPDYMDVMDRIREIDRLTRQQRTRGNPYSYGPRVQDSAMFFGREAELSTLRARLCNMQSVSVVGQRRIGKSSLLYQLSQTLCEELGSSFVPLYIDLHDARYLTPASFFSMIAEALNERMGGILNVSGVTDLARFTELAERLSDAGIHPVLCLDEFEELLKNPKNLRDDFLEALRSLGGQSTLAMVTASRIPLFDLIQTGQLTSPFYNIFSQLELGLLEPGAAQKLRHFPFERDGIELGHEDEALLQELGGRHPCFLNMACYHLYEALSESSDRRAETVRERFNYDAEYHFESLWNHLDVSEKAALRGVVGGSAANEEAEIVLKRLARAGIVEQDNGSWRLFSQAFTNRVQLYLAQEATTTPTRQVYNIPTIRNLLNAAFSDEELVIMCFDFFPEVYERFASSMTRTGKIQVLLEHCISHMRIEFLLEIVMEANPAQYARFKDRL